MSYQQNKEGNTIALQLRAGDPNAFQYLMDEYGPALYLFAIRLTGHEATAADIVEEALLQLWETREQFYTLTAIGNFLYASTGDGCRRHLQKQQAAPVDKHTLQQALIRAEVIRLISHQRLQNPVAPDHRSSIQPC